MIFEMKKQMDKTPDFLLDFDTWRGKFEKTLLLEEEYGRQLEKLSAVNLALCAVIKTKYEMYHKRNSGMRWTKSARRELGKLVDKAKHYEVLSLDKNLESRIGEIDEKVFANFLEAKITNLPMLVILEDKFILYKTKKFPNRRLERLAFDRLFRKAILFAQKIAETE